jgi:hypothetical protein
MEDKKEKQQENSDKVQMFYMMSINVEANPVELSWDLHKIALNFDCR